MKLFLKYYLLASTLTAVIFIAIKFNSHGLRYISTKAGNGKYIASSVVFDSKIEALDFELKAFLNMSDYSYFFDFVNAILTQDTKKALLHTSAKNKERNLKNVKELIRYFSTFKDVKVKYKISYSNKVLFLLSAKYKEKDVHPMFSFDLGDDGYKFNSIDNSSFATEIIGLWAVHSNQENADVDRLGFWDWINYVRTDCIKHQIEEGFNICVPFLDKQDKEINLLVAYLEQLNNEIEKGDKDVIIKLLFGSVTGKVKDEISGEDLLLLNNKFSESTLRNVLNLGRTRMVFIGRNKKFIVGDDLVFFVTKNADGNFEPAFLGGLSFWHRLLVYSNFNEKITNNARVKVDE